MKAAPTAKTSERVGRWLARVWRGVAHRETRAIHWLAEQGISARVGRLFFLGVKLIVLALLLYSMFWVTVLTVVTWGVARFAWLDRDVDNPEPEWRTGPAGFGLYTYDGHRVDPHVHDGDD